MKAPYLTDDDGNEVELPWAWEICGRCEGHGTSSAYLGAFTGEQLRDDPEFAEDYFAGRYDRPCEKCGGHGKVKTVVWAKLTRKQKSEWRAEQEAERACRAEERAERLMCFGLEH